MMMTMMIRRADLDLNYSGCSEAEKEAVRRAMLYHETVFKSQVQELHRLYWTQKNLMRELCRTRAAAAASPAEEKGVFLPPRCETAMGPKLFGRELRAAGYIRQGGGGSNVREVIDLEQAVELERDGKLDGFGTPAANREKLFDCDSFSRTGDGGGHMPPKDDPGAGLNGHSGAPSLDPANPKQQSTSCKILDIDLNAPLHDDRSDALHEPASMFSSASTSSSIVHRGGYDESHSGTPRLVSTIWRDSNNECSKETSYGSPSKCSMEQNADTLLVSEKSLKAADSSPTRDPYEADKIAHGSEFVGPKELYKNSVDGFASDFNNGAWNRVNGALPGPTILYEVGDKTNDRSLDQEHCRVDSDSRWQASIMTSCSNDREDNNRHASNLSTNLPCSTKHVESKQANCGSEDHSLLIHSAAEDEEKKDELLEESPTEENSNDFTGNNECSSREKSVERHTFVSIDKDSGTRKIDSQITEISPGKEILEVGSYDGNCINEKACSNNIAALDKSKQQAQGAELDSMVKKAAEALVSLSLDNLACPSDQVGSSVSVELDVEERSDGPQYSSDSFESITLLLTESRIEEFSTSSGPTVNETGKETCGIKLRRGRGLRDFQKEILPGLVSLSWHEICEDLHSIGYEVRRSRSRNRKNWLILPVSSRQSRCYSTRRRR